MIISKIRWKLVDKINLQAFKGSKVHSHPWTAFERRINEKNVSFIRPHPKF